MKSRAAAAVMDPASATSTTYLSCVSVMGHLSAGTSRRFSRAMYQSTISASLPSFRHEKIAVADKPSYFVTTPIYYVNAAPGRILERACDVQARYRRAVG